jgi:hypothetical protein
LEIKVADIVEQENGESVVMVDIDDEFKEWFKATQGLKRWSQKRFEKWFVEAMSQGLERLNLQPAKEE